MLKKTFCLLFIIASLSSCTHYYGPALMNADIAYQPKPMSQDSVKHANYVSASLSNGTTSDFDMVTFGQINLARGYALKNFNVAAGGYGFLGRYMSAPAMFKQDAPQDFIKTFSGVGARASANYFTARKRSNFRIIGLEASYSKEFGAYSKFRTDNVGNPYYAINPTTTIFTAGLTSEIIWHTKRSVDTQHSLRLFVGDIFSNQTYLVAPSSPAADDYNPTYVSLSYFLKLNNICLNLESSLFSSRFSLGYRF